MRDGWLLVALAALLAVVAATWGGSVGRRRRRILIRVVAALVGCASLAGMAGLVWLAQAGPDSVRATIRGAWQDMQAGIGPLPRVHYPTPAPSAGIPRPAPAGSRLDGIVTHVRDGDTIEVGRRPIRLSGLTCDERGTVLGDRATAAMRRLVQGRPVHCVLDGERTHDREVGRCRLAGGEDLGAMMIASRLCGRCARHDPGRDYAALQAEVGAFPGDNPGYCRTLW